MLKDFLFELFGIRFYGLTFERILLTLIVFGGMFILYRTWRERKEAGMSGVSPGMFGSGAVLIYVAYNWIRAWFSNSYELFFSDPLILHTYGVAIATGFIVGIWLAVIEAKRTGLDPNKIVDGSFWALVGGLGGSRLGFMIFEGGNYYNMCFDPAAEGLSKPDCTAMFRFWEGGLVFYGGLILATIMVLWFMHKANMPKARFVDVIVPAVPIGQFFGRLGCLAAGCCHGKFCPPDMLVALSWPKGTQAYKVIMPNLPPSAEQEVFKAGQFITAHPTQFYEAGFMLLCVIFLLWFRTKKTFHGQVLLLYIALYAVARSIIELFRGDTARGDTIFGLSYKNAAISEALGLPLDQSLLLSTSQGISLVMFTGAVIAYIYLWRKAKKQAPNEGS